MCLRGFWISVGRLEVAVATLTQFLGLACMQLLHGLLKAVWLCFEAQQLQKSMKHCHTVHGRKLCRQLY